MARREDIINDQHEGTRGLTLQQRADIRTMAHRIKVAMRDTPLVSVEREHDIAYTAVLNVLGDLIATFFRPEEASKVREAQTLLPIQPAGYRRRVSSITAGSPSSRRHAGAAARCQAAHASVCAVVS